MKSKSNTTSMIFIYGISLLLSLIWLNIYLYEPVYTYVRQNIITSNIVPYAIFILIFVISVLLGQIIVSRIHIKLENIFIPAWVVNISSTAVVLINLVLLGICYIHEQSLFDAPDDSMLLYHQNNKMALLGMTIIFCFAIIIVEHYQWKDITVGRWEQFVVGLGLLGIGSIFCYALFTPNSFQRFYDIYHNNAYYNSVFSALHGAPRSDLNCSVYGFYGLLLAPFIRILGGTTLSFYYVICAIGLLSFLCMAYAIWVLIKSDLVRWLSVIALIVGTTSMHWGIYLQLIPHRVLFSSIILAYIAFSYKHKVYSIIYNVIGYFICALSLIWNFETGIVCLLAFVSYLALESLKKYNLKQGKLYIEFFEYIMAMLLTILGALGIVNIINRILGGGWISLKTLMFPLMDSEYITGELTTDYQKGVVAWLFIAAMALLLIFNGLSKTKLNPSFVESTRRSNVLFGLGVLALGQMTYYINRSAYGNLSIAYFTAITMIGVLANHCIYFYSRNKKEHSFMSNIERGFAYTTIAVLITIIVGGIYNYAGCQQFRLDNNYRDTTEAEAVEAQIEAYCPKDTRALGLSVAELYSDLGWDAYYYLVDFADTGVYPKAYSYLQEELNENLNVPLLIDSNALQEIEKKEDLTEFYSKFTVQHTFQLYGTEIYYYVHK